MATELAKAYVQIIPSADGIGKGIEDALNPSAEKAGASAGSKIASGIGTALAAGTSAIVGFAAASVAAGSDFDSAMSQVAATMGVTTDEIGDLREFALDMGSTTSFSATQAAEALNYMALAGYSSEEAMEALPNVLNLAAAGGIDLARASDMVTDAQSALGLTMDESAALVDQMAMASSKSNTSVEQLGDAILTVGGTAKNLSGGTTELATALGILADNGIKGAEGGTALRNMILSLSTPTDKAAATLDALGVSVFDAEGNMRSLNDVFGDLNVGMSSLTQEERVAALSEIFNARDLKSAEAMLSNVGDRWDELSGYIDNAQGSAQKMADTQLDNLAGDVTLFQSALEGAEIAVSDSLTPTLREFVQFGTSGVTQIADAFQSGGLEGAADALGDVLSQGIAMLTGMLPDLVTAGQSLLLALAEGILSNAGQLAETALTIIVALANGLTSALPTLIPIATQAVLDIADALISNADQFLQAGLDLFLATADGILQAIPQIVAMLPQLLESIISFLVSAAPQIAQAGVDLLVSLTENLDAIISSIVAVLPALISGLVSGLLGEGLPALIEAGISLFTSLIQNLPEIILTIVQALPDLIGGIIDGLLGEGLPALIEAGISLFVAIIENTPAIIAGIAQHIPEIIEGILTAFANIGEKMWEVGSNIVSGIWEGIQKAWDWLVEQFSALWDGLVGGVKDFLGIHSPSTVFAEIGENMGLGLGDGFSGAMDGVRRDIEREMAATSALASDFGAAYESVGTDFGVYNITIDAASVREFNDIVNLAKNQRRLGRMVTA